jgi:hypothetical protein
MEIFNTLSHDFLFGLGVGCIGYIIWKKDEILDYIKRFISGK